MGTFTQGVGMECSADGVPLRMQWQGRQWVIGPEPLRWYERRPWWRCESRMPAGAGAGMVDTRIWRLQIRPAAALPESPQTRRTAVEPWRTIDVVQQRPGGTWRVIKIHEASQEYPEGAEDSA